MEALERTVQIAWRFRIPITWAMSALVWMFSLLAVTQCNFMKSNIEEMGLFSRPYMDSSSSGQQQQSLGCVSYHADEDIVDSTLRAGQALGALTCVFTTWTFLATSVAILVAGASEADDAKMEEQQQQPSTSRRRRRVLLLGSWYSARGSIVVATVTQMLTFVALGAKRCSLEGCRLTGVGSLAVLNTMILMLLSFGCCFVPVPSSGQGPRIQLWTKKLNDSTNSDENAQNRSETLSSSRRRATTNENAAVTTTVPMIEESSDDESSNEEKKDDDSENDATMLRDIQQLTSFRLVTVGLIGLAWFFSILGVNRCKFLLAGRVAGQPTDNSYGLFRQSVMADNGDRSTYLGCLSHSQEFLQELDSDFRAARAFGVLTTLILSIILMLGILQLFTQWSTVRAWKSKRVLLPTAAFSQLVVFSIFGSDLCHHDAQGFLTECRPGGTGILAILNVFMLVSLSLLVVIVKPPQQPVFSLRLWNHDEAQPATRCAANPKLRPEDEEARNERLQYDEEPINDEDDNEESSMGDDMISKWVNHANSMPAAMTSQTHSSDASTESDYEKVDSITVKVEFTENEKKTIRIVRHTDGSETITTTIEDLCDDDETTQGSYSYSD